VNGTNDHTIRRLTPFRAEESTRASEAARPTTALHWRATMDLEARLDPAGSFAWNVAPW
jgi:hypothetical protein